MEGNEKEVDDRATLTINGFSENVIRITTEWHEIITVLDLSNKDISNIQDDMQLPTNLNELDLSHNKLTEIPANVINLKKLTSLNLSFNSLVSFDSTPNFCHTLEYLNLSNNHLQAPPFWIWLETPKKLVKLNLSNNKDLCQTLEGDIFEEILQYTTLVRQLDISNCRLNKHMNLMLTFVHSKEVDLGSMDYNYYSLNHLDNVPCLGLDKCCDIEKLNVCNTNIYTINQNIDMYKYLKEINLAQNYINGLPNEFCNLDNLEVCILSYNRLLYLPDDIIKLKKLVKLFLDNNSLCMMPDNLHTLDNLKTLDLYNNNISELTIDVQKYEEVDFAQNYFEELNGTEYLKKREKLRLNYEDRLDGRKTELIQDDSDYSRIESDDEELYDLLSNGDMLHESPVSPQSHCSTPEDWDSDNYWVPHYYKQASPPRSPWLYFVKKKMEEGNFCPMDAHAVSITEKVKYEKMCNPQPVYESDGQFDDYSEDDS